MDKENFAERYHRQIILKGFGIEAQQKLAASRILVIGAGGLGCPALQYLTAAGLGTIGIADNDVVSVSNLHRQVLYSTEDVGRFKAEVAAVKLRRQNPDVSIIVHPFRIDNSNALDIIRSYDLVIDGTDNFASRYMINDACVLLKKPLIYGAVSQYEGQVAIFNMADENDNVVNYRNLFPTPPKEGEVMNCAEAGVLGVLPGIIGTMQAAETIKLITGIGKPLINKLVTYNVLTNELYEISLTPSSTGTDLLPKNETAFREMTYGDACNSNENSLVEIDARQLKILSQQPSSVIIDVREKGEQPLVTRLPHRQIPMSVFRERRREIKEQNVILFCQHGARSLYAGELLKELFGASKKVYSLKGGLVKWADELEL